MASAQVALDQAAFDELVKKAQSQVAERGEINPQEQVFLLGQLRNVTSGPMNLHEKKSWFGEYIRELPTAFANNTTAEFEEVARVENGIKSAAIYAGRQNQVAWLVSWSNPQVMQEKKVYVDCGPIEKFKNIDWANVEYHLNKSTEQSSHVDPITRTAVQARILPPLGKSASSDGIMVAVFHG